ncbi:hypothetical protein B2G67_01135 [Microbacterium foliorum]|nr:hypothetical protein B2G67_01135 [Microbacterium foliorum]
MLGVAASIAMLTATNLTACAPASGRCLPAPLEASPTGVRPGESLTVTSEVAECDLGYGDGAAYSIVVISSSGEKSEEVDVPVAEDGSFSTEVVVPESFPAGQASVVVSGSSYDDCGDDSGSCAAYIVEVTVES